MEHSEYKHKTDILETFYCRKLRVGCDKNNSYQTPGCEDTDDAIDEDDEVIDSPDTVNKVTVNNIHLTININVEPQCGNETKTHHYVVKDENSEKLLNIVQNVLLQNGNK